MHWGMTERGEVLRACAEQQGKLAEARHAETWLARASVTTCKIACRKVDLVEL